MKTLLLINSSPDLHNSASRQLTEMLVKQWQQLFPNGQVIKRDIGENPIPHLLQGSLEPIISPQQVTTQGQVTRNLYNKLIAEIKTADLIVFGVPMFNLSIPSTLKAYFDHIAIAGETWGGVDYGKNKHVVVITTGGSSYQNTEYDFQAPYIKAFLKTIDLENVSFIGAHSLCKSDEMRQASLTQAKLEIKEYIDKFNNKVSLSNSELYLRDGLKKYSSGNYTDAINDFTQAIQLEPNCAELFLHRGDAYYALQQYPAALQDYSNAISHDASNPIFYANRAEAKRQSKNITGSTEDLTIAIALDNKQKQQIDYPYYRIARDLAKGMLTTHSPTFYADMANRAYKGFTNKLKNNLKNQNNYKPYTLYYLARCYEIGCGTEKNQQKAKQYYKEASQQVLPTERLAYKLKKRINNIESKSTNENFTININELSQVKLAKL